MSIPPESKKISIEQYCVSKGYLKRLNLQEKSLEYSSDFVNKDMSPEKMLSAKEKINQGNIFKRAKLHSLHISANIFCTEM